MRRRTRPDRAPGTVWTLRSPRIKAGQTNGHVQTMPDDYIGIGVYGDFRVGPGSIVLSRRDARLLAKRINQCLDETAKIPPALVPDVPTPTQGEQP